MLNLTLKFGKSLHIGDDIKITVEDTPHPSRQVAFHIDAPREVAITRGELIPPFDEVPEE